MTTALNKLGPFDFTRACDKDVADAPVFKLRPLTSLQKLEVMEVFNRDGNVASIRRTLRHGLCGWDRLTDASDQSVLFLAGNFEENVARLPIEVIDELANAIFDASQVSEAERKN